MIRYWAGRKLIDLGMAICQFPEVSVDLTEEPDVDEPIPYGYLVKPLYTPAPGYLESMGTYRRGDC